MANYCKKCGAAIAPGAGFCKQCGAPVEVNNSQIQPQPYGYGNAPIPVNGPSQQGGNKNTVVAVVAVVAVLVIAACVFFALKSDDKPAAPAQPVQTQQASNTDAQKKEKLAKLVKDKDALDLEIKELANAVNDYLKYNSNFMGSSANNVKYRAKTTLEHVHAVQSEARAADVGNQAVKTALLDTLDAEEGRANGLYKGIMDSATNGDYSIGFGEGTKAAYRFDEANARLNSLMGK